MSRGPRGCAEAARMVRKPGDGVEVAFLASSPRGSHICEQIRPVVSGAGVSIQRVVWPALGNQPSSRGGLG